MFGCGHRTPAKASQNTKSQSNQMTESPKGDLAVRKSLSRDECQVAKPRPVEGGESTRAGPSQTLVEKAGLSQTCVGSQTRDIQAISRILDSVTSQGSGAVSERETPPATPPLRTAFSQSKGRVAEAKTCLIKTKLQLNNSRNLKAEIKTEVLQAVERLYQLVKEAEAGGQKEKQSKGEKQEERNQSSVWKKGREEVEIMRAIEEHTQLIRENNAAMKLLNGTLEKQKEAMERSTYASVAAGVPKNRNLGQAALHSVVVSSKDITETGDEVLTQIREAVNAKEGWVKIDRVRKAKDRKVIVGCSSEEERQKVKEKLKSVSDRLNVEEIQNKDPLLILRDVLQYNSDDDIKNALRKQNQRLFENIDEDRIEIRFRRRTRNPHANHVIIRVCPKLWLRMVEAGAVHIDMQKIRVADYSPLVQCSLCLGYGHGRRFCKDSVAKCSHCGGPHMKAECVDWVANSPPACCNCSRLKLDQIEHNAFSQECPVRRKWDALARASIAYC